VESYFEVEFHRRKTIKGRKSWWKAAKLGKIIF
jgi:hypothetical protein